MVPRSVALARLASSGVAARSRFSRSISLCRLSRVCSVSSLWPLLTRIWGSPRAVKTGPRWARSTAISSAARGDGGVACRRSSTLVPSAAAIVRSIDSLGSRLPFSIIDTWEGARSIAAARLSRVILRAVRRSRMRRPSVSASRPDSSSGVSRRGERRAGSAVTMSHGHTGREVLANRRTAFLLRGNLVRGVRRGPRVGAQAPHRSRPRENIMTESAARRPGDQTQTAAELELEWAADTRWDGIRRDYTAADVIALRGTVREERTLARRGAEKLFELINENGTPENPEWVRALGALTGNQAVQQVRAGLKAIYLSGWQVAADANLSGQTYPDQSLYPANSVPAVVRRINNALLRADQIETSEGGGRTREWLAPIVADAEAGFGGPLNAYELMASMIEAGAAGVHWEDQLAAEKKCGHLGGKVLVPTSQHVRTLSAARLAADVAGVPTVVIARTDALGADLLTSDVDPRDVGREPCRA